MVNAASEIYFLLILGIFLDWLLQREQVWCCWAWGNLDHRLATKLYKLQNRAARTMTFQGYDVRSAEIRIDWEELASMRQRRLSLSINVW